MKTPVVVMPKVVGEFFSIKDGRATPPGVLNNHPYAECILINPLYEGFEFVLEEDTGLAVLLNKVGMTVSWIEFIDQRHLYSMYPVFKPVDYAVAHDQGELARFVDLLSSSEGAMLRYEGKSASVKNDPNLTRMMK